MNSVFYKAGDVPIPVAHKLGKSLITLPGGADLVCASAQFTYKRAVTQLLPVNLFKKLLIAGEPEGSLILTVVVGPSQGFAAFLERYADPDNINNQSNTVLLTPGEAGAAKTARWVYRGCLLVGIGGGVNRTTSGNVMIPQIELMFCDMGMDD